MTKLQEQVQKDSNAQMGQLLSSPVVPVIPSTPTPQVPNSRLDQLNQFKIDDYWGGVKPVLQPVTPTNVLPSISTGDAK
jgi:hypothetical protein